MKTRNLILMGALLLAGTWAGDLLAQTNLNALMKKCESMDKVSVDVIYDKDRKTKKPVKEVVTITFSAKDNPKLLDDFMNAFRQDKEAAYKVVEKKLNGKVMPSLYRFAAGTTDISYSMDDLEQKFKGNEYMLRNGNIRVTKIERFDFKEESEWG